MTGVLLTRSDEENKVATKKLESLGVAVYTASMLRYIDLSYVLPAKYKHLIITSKHAARIIAQNNTTFVECWVIGKESANILAQNPHIKVTGIAKNLRELLNIIELIPTGESIAFFRHSVYLSGNIITQALPQYITRQVIYEVQYIQAMPQNTIDAIKGGRVKLIMVYSKNCALNLIEVLTRYNLLPYIRSSVVMAISEQVAVLFNDLAMQVVYSDTTDFDGILELLKKYGQNSQNI